MSWLGRWLRRARYESSLSDELEAHVAHQVDDYVARGMAPEEARRRALVELGGVAQITEECRDARGTQAVESTLRDLRFALRLLRRNPGFAAAVVLTLALGLGANVTLFSVARAVVFRDLSAPEPDRLVRLYEVDPHGGTWPFSQPDLLDVSRETNRLSGVAGVLPLQRSLGGGGAVVRVTGAAVSASFFRVLGVTSLAGAPFTAAQDRPGNPDRVVVITRRLWRSWFDGQTGVVGAPVNLDGDAYTVVGIVDDVPDLLPGAEVLLPLGADPAASREGHEIETIGRLSAGASRADAAVDLDRIAADLARTFPTSNAGWRVRVDDLKASLLGPELPRMVWVQFGAVTLFGLLACINVAGLLVARGIARRDELTLRAALGASRRRLVRQLLLESTVLAGIGTAAGLGLAALALAAIRRLGPDFVPRLAAARLDGFVVLFSLALMAAAVLTFGLGPALSGARAGLGGGLRSRRATARSDRRGALVAAQTAIAVTLLAGAALLFRSFLALHGVNPGYDPSKLLSVHPVLSGTDWPEARLVPFFTDLDAQLRRLPGVEAVGATNVAPLGTWSSAIQYRRVEQPPESALLQGNWRTVTPGFFRAMGLRLVRGRLFDDRDTADAPDVTVVTESLAARTWPGENPLGRQIVWGRTGEPKTVIGVVTDLRDHVLDRDPQPTMFRTYPQVTWPDMTVIVRTTGDPAALAPDVRRVVSAAAPGVAIDIAPVSDAVGEALERPRVNVLMMGAFALLGLMLAVIGLYGLVSYGVRLRRQEIAIRLALGASAGTVMWTLLRQALSWTLAGVVAGLAGGVALSRLLGALLFGAGTTGAGVYLLVFVSLAVVALAASLIPARRALRIDPATVLRHE
jgi:putative ABC transport system permease protein